MYFLNKKVFGLFFLLVGLSISSCDSLFKEEPEKEPLARVGESYLYKEDVTNLIPTGMAGRDSAAFVVNYINNWASKELLLDKAKINLPEDKLEEFDRLVSNYRTDLYTRAYMEALVSQSADTLVSNSELQDFYNREKENFKLTEKLVQLRFVSLPKQFLDKEVIVQKLKNFRAEDKAYLDSIAVQFKKLHFNDSVWVSAPRLIEEIPPLTSLNEEKYLKNSQFFELQDSIGVYLGKVSKVLNINEVAPISYAAPDIKQIIINRKRLSRIKKIETEIIDEAIKKNEFEIYGKD
ncbi:MULTISPECIES: peptidyl-prolyl cis-trans isomerase [unclassified Croceitalea]|uniref:peptidyl-prolyl cis-trans isomerase n=1 Tax=unclassified Croceitalea TaxID=2632280 RepID=UPI0030D9CD70